MPNSMGRLLALLTIVRQAGKNWKGQTILAYLSYASVRDKKVYSIDYN